MQQDAVNFADCMRSHGVTNFPDPTTAPHEIKAAISPGSALTLSPAFRSAATACQHLLPGGSLPGQTEAHSEVQIAALLAFTRCIRSHGFLSFPDPTSQGQLTPEMVSAAGINLHQPGLLRAGLACVPVTHGLLTRAAVEQAVNGG